ncbi:MAG: Uma2 family endonuclease [Planctomycetes bacterium]|nr:Uma2 family endonuclease [Planctomycetota bacterium]
MSRDLLFTPPAGDPPIPELPPLTNGDHLDQPTFHARYEAMPADFRAELIEGVVIVSSPQSTLHGIVQRIVNGWLWYYEVHTPGTQGAMNFTNILGMRSEPEPDCGLWIAPAFGGRTRPVGKYTAGPPELLAEVSLSSEAYDLHSKKRDYERAGVLEYLVVMLREQRVVWFVLRDGRYAEMPPDSDGIYRSTVFPGLWLDPQALLSQDSPKLLETLHRGLADPSHQAFIDRLKNASTAEPHQPE